jgi:hypothetical protein
MLLLYQSPATRTLSPFRFSRIGRLNSSAFCLSLSNSHTYTFPLGRLAGIFRL